MHGGCGSSFGAHSNVGAVTCRVTGSCCHLIGWAAWHFGAGGKTSLKRHCLRIFVIFEKETSQSSLLLCRIDRHPGSEQNTVTDDVAEA